MRLIFWNASKHQLSQNGITGKRFLSIHVLCTSHHKHLIKEFFTLRLQVLQVWFQCKDNHEFFFPVDIPQNSMVGQQRQQISELQFDKIILHTFNVFMLEDMIQTPSKCLFQFTGGNGMDRKSGDGRFGGRFEIIALNSGFFLISRILRCWMRGLRLL